MYSQAFMFPVRDNLITKEKAYVTYTLVLLNVIIYLWDRGGLPFGSGWVFADLAMRPNDVVQGLRTGNYGSLPTLFTCMFLHGSFTHLLGNMIYLLVFGTNVEHALGAVRFAVCYLIWGFLASAAHIFVDPHSPIPTLGASGAIGGILGCYLLLFPANRVTIWVFFYETVLPAWILLGLWFLWQVFLPQEGVANWAHAGGFVAGMLTVLILGGRQKVLRETPLEEDPDYDPA